MKEIILTKGFVTVVDDEDFEWLTQRKWHACIGNRGKVYARSRNGGRTKIRMHQLIMNPPDGFCVDHIDGNTMNNQRSNLRICTQAENGRNSRINKTHSTGFKGVYQAKSGRYIAHILSSGRLKHLGTFDTPEEAYEVWCMTAKELHGDFARFK